ncbi:Hypothetical protein PACV_213 [Pacmanvirus A23]|uniref:Hypothetical protein n=1 Tax=Pacmanvirus A23 TaxID=1932881 RepID=UPI000A091B17|nr:Hypothetical protein B9W72_gp211 [Pacmanvirus A23]SIP85928.1 Hypothetical protein PACV_213 [Pacmanvirus A23]
MQSLVNLSLGTIFKHYENIEMLLELNLQPYEKIRIINELRMRNISKIIISGATIRAIKSVIVNKLSVYAELMSKIGFACCENKIMYKVKHSFGRNYNLSINKYCIRLAHEFYFRPKIGVFVIPITNPRKSQLYDMKPSIPNMVCLD